jgi:hypothetical protein
MIQRLCFEDLLRFHVDFRTSHALGGCNEDIWVRSNEHSMRTSALGDQAGLCEDSSIEIVSDWIFMFSENKRKHSTDLCEDVSTIEDRKEDISMAL